MTRRCSVMRMPVAAQRASMPVVFSAGMDFSAVMVPGLNVICCATARDLRQVAAHQNGVQMFAARLLVIAFAVAGDAKSGALVEPARRSIVFLDLEEYGAHATACEMAEMCQQQFAGQPAAAMFCIHRNRKNFRLVRRHTGNRKADQV